MTVWSVRESSISLERLKHTKLWLTTKIAYTLSPLKARDRKQQNQHRRMSQEKPMSSKFFEKSALKWRKEKLTIPSPRLRLRCMWTQPLTSLKVYSTSIKRISLSDAALTSEVRSQTRLKCMTIAPSTFSTSRIGSVRN